MKLIFASNNNHKLNEIKSILNAEINIISLKDAGISIDIPEPYNTLNENAEEKARIINRLTNQNCFSEDTGLEVYSLNNEPGAKSARYAGEGRSDEENINKLLNNLKNKDRRARFRTVICLIVNNHYYFFEGICEGLILSEPKGSAGFGYDPIFKPLGSDSTFAEMTIIEKNRFSHRKKAIDKLVTFLNTVKHN